MSDVEETLILNRIDELEERLATKLDKRLPDERPLYTIATLAERLGLSQRTVREMTSASGPIPSYLVGGARRIDPAEVDRYLAAQRGDARSETHD